MAKKTTELAIRTSGGAKVESDLKKIGAIGEQTGKKIESGSKKASRGLKAFDSSIARTNASMRRMADNLGPVGAGLSKLGPAGLAAAAGLAAFSLGLSKVVTIAEQAERSNFKIAALLETTDQSSGQTAESIDRIAKSIGQLTLASTGGVRDAAAALLTFKAVSGDAFERTLRVAQDLSAVMGTEMRSSAIQLAKALEDPERNLSQLNRSGISFTQNQIELVKSLVQTGDAAEALSVILDQIEGQVGGAGEAEAAGLAGRFDSLAENVKEFAENIAQGTGVLSLFAANVDKVARTLKAFNDELFPDAAIERMEVIGRIAELSEKLESRRTAGLPRIFAERQLKTEKERLAVLNEAIKAQADATLAAQGAASTQAKARADERLSAEATKAATKEAAEQEKKRATEAKKTATERKKALADIARLEDKASKAGLGGLALLTLERDKELLKQFDRLNQSLITSQEFADARLAIEKSFNAEKTELAEKAAKDTTKKMAAEAEKQVSVFVSPFSTAVSNIQSSFADTFTEIYRNGETSFEDLSNRIKDIFARLAGEITALMVIRPVIASVSGSFAGSAAGSAAGSSAGASSGGLGSFLAGAGGSFAGALPGGSTGMLAHIGKSAGAAFAAHLATNYVSEKFGQNTNVGGNIGGLVGGTVGMIWGPAGSAIGATIGTFAGNTIGNLLGAGSNETQRFGFSTGATGATGIDSPFGTLSIDRQRGVDALAILESLATIDESLAGLLSDEQISRVQAGLAGTSQRFDVNSFDNESFDVVKTRLIRIIDSVAENTVASGLLNSIGRDPGNIDELVQSAQGIIELINVFQDDGAELNDAELALAALNEQFDMLADTAEKLGFAITDVETKRQQAITDLTADFNTSIRDQILAIEDPFTLTLENIARAAEERLENARSLGADLVEAERLTALERAQAFDQAFGGANSSITKFLDSLKTTGAGGLSIAEQTANAESQFNSLLGSARTDPTARADLAALLPTLLDLKRDQLGSTSSFFEFTSFLDSTLRNLVDQGDTVSTLQSIGTAITIGDNAIVETLREEIGGLKIVIGGMVDDMNLLLNAPTAA